jgi:outer membrane protein assembly factor BamB
MNIHRFTLQFVVAFAFGSGSFIAWAENGSWSQFRGTDFNSVVVDTKLNSDLDPSKAIWKTSLASGASTPVVSNDRLFVTTFDGKELAVECRSLADGQTIWRTPVPAKELEAYFALLGSPAASSCSIDGQRIISYFGSVGLVCHNWNGEEVWRVDMPLPKSRDGFGSGTSPIVHEGRVYLLRDEDGPGSGLYAIDASTGKQLWRVSREGFRVSFGTPVIWDDSLVCIGDVRVKGYDLKTGAEKWTFVGSAAYPCTSPAVGPDGKLYIATWSPGSSNEQGMPSHAKLAEMFDADKDGKLSRKEMDASFLKDFFEVNDKNKNSFLDVEEWDPNLTFMSRGKNVVFAIHPGAKGDVTKQVAWLSEKGAPYVSSPLVYENRVVLIKDGGLMTCYDAASGKLLSGPKRIGAAGDYYASPVGMDSKIVTASLEGVVTVLKSSDSPEVISSADFKERIWATPVVVGETMLIRTASQLYAFRTTQP